MDAQVRWVETNHVAAALVPSLYTGVSEGGRVVLRLAYHLPVPANME